MWSWIQGGRILKKGVCLGGWMLEDWVWCSRLDTARGSVAGWGVQWGRGGGCDRSGSRGGGRVRVVGDSCSS